MSKNTDSIASKILCRIKSHKRGWVFTPDCFADLGSRNAVDLALKRYRDNGVIRRLDRGLYDYPIVDRQFGIIPPSAIDVAKVIAKRDGTKFQETGIHAANMLGLSTQVPMKYVFMTTGPSQYVSFGEREIKFKHMSHRKMHTAGKFSGLIIQALRWLGPKRVEPRDISRINRLLDAAARRQLMKDTRHAPAWMGDILRTLASKESTE